jgi:hypothetical protein
VRAECTFLAHAHAEAANDPLAQTIDAAGSNGERAKALAAALIAGTPVTATGNSHELAQRRMKRVLADIKVGLAEIRSVVNETLQRLYRQRNLVVHWGRVDAVCLPATLRVAAPLIGAGFDRIAHHWFVLNVAPLRLAAIAQTELALLGTSSAAEVTALLGN